MSSMHPQPFVIRPGGTVEASTYTSGPYLVADLRDYQALSWETVAAVASNLTVQGTLMSGATQTLREADWSTLSVAAAQGLFTIDPGSRYIRVIRPAVNSLSTVIFHGA